MKRLVYCPAGRTVWFDLACRLEEDGVATPVVWFGDRRHEASAAARFPGAHVAPMDQIYFGDLSSAPPYTGAHAGFFRSEAFARAHERAGKMLDRLDRDGTLKAPSREVYLTRAAMWAAALVEAQTPDAMLMAESPHGPAAYMLYELCVWLGLPVFSFMSWSFVPGLGLRDGIAGPMRPAPASARNAGLDAHVAGLMQGFHDRMTAPASQADAPDFMQAQARRERKYRLPAKLLGAFRRGGAAKHALRGVFAADAVSRAAYGSRAATRVERTDALRQAIAAETSEATGPYVYFPLHYEPERTTNPDGGAFHDQLRALAALRSLLPGDVGIRIKEHPSQLMISNKGFLGRAPGFYAAAKGIAGVTIAPMEVASRRLIAESRGVATITGTAAVEAALLGKPALVFGTAWFEGCPNTVAWRDDLTASEFLNHPPAASEAVLAWMMDRWHKVGLFGTVNPSNERLHAALYEDPAVGGHETTILRDAIAEALA